VAANLTDCQHLLFAQNIAGSDLVNAEALLSPH